MDKLLNELAMTLHYMNGKEMHIVIKDCTSSSLFREKLFVPAVCVDFLFPQFSLF
jgi:hypothetical protein